MLELSMDAVDTFECIGNLCDDTCCKDWLITIDQSTYFKYKKESNTEFKEMFDTSVSRLRCASKDAYAIMNLNKKGECFFLDDNKLCSVYKLLGPEKMCNTCKFYPRYNFDVYGIKHKSLTISCPEACRKILFRKDPIEFNLNEVIANNSSSNKKSLQNKNNKSVFDKEIFLTLRSFAISLIQNREYTLEERLIILGMFMEDISDKNNNEILNIVYSYYNNISNGIFKNASAYINRDDLINLEIKTCSNIYLQIISSFSNKQLLKLMSNIENALLINGTTSSDEIRLNYIKIKNNYYKNIYTKYEYVFENYLVNYMFKHSNMFMTKTLLSNYIEMLIYYAMTKFSIIASIANLKDEFTENDLVLAISTLARGVEHNQKNIKSLKTFADNFNLNSLSSVIHLILM